MPVITISRQYGSYGDAVAELLSDRLGYRILDKNLMWGLAGEAGLQLKKAVDLSEDQHRPRTRDEGHNSPEREPRRGGDREDLQRKLSGILRNFKEMA